MVVYHQKGSVFRMYSLYQVMANSTVTGAKIGQRFSLDEYTTGTVGEPGFGIPVAKIRGILYQFVFCMQWGTWGGGGAGAPSL